MTVIVAAKHKESSVIMADSLITADYKKTSNLADFNKLLDFNHFIVGFAGDCAMYTVLKEMQSNQSYRRKRYMKMKGIEDALKFSRDAYTGLKKSFNSAPSFNPDEDDDGTELIIITKDSLFTVDPLLGILEHNKYATIGSGSDLATGAMSILYEGIRTKRSLRAAVEKAVKIAIQHNNECGLPITMMEF